MNHANRAISPQGGADPLRAWVYPAVEALTAIMASAAPLKDKLTATCSSMIDRMDAQAVWIMGTADGAPAVLSVNAASGPLARLVRATDQSRHLELISSLERITLQINRSHSTHLDRQFLIDGAYFTAVCFPLVTQGASLGALVCLFGRVPSRSDSDLLQLKVCARVLALAIGASADKEAKAQKLESAWKMRFDSLAQTLPGQAAVILPSGEIGYASRSKSTEGGGCDLIQPAASAVSTGREYTHRQSEAFRSALNGEAARCHVNRHGDLGLRIIEQRFSPVSDANGSVHAVTLYAQDVTDAAMREQTARNASERDPVTGLLTMEALREKAALALGSCDAAGSRLLFMSIVVSCSVSSSFPIHDADEALLQAICARLRRCLPGAYVLARRVEREFAALIDMAGGRQPPSEIAAVVISELRQPILIGRTEQSMTASVGFSVFPEDGRSVEDLLSNAEVAANNAQRAGRNCALAYRPEMARLTQERMLLEARLYRAVEKEELRLVFQPKIQISSGAVIGAEALLRWPGEHGASPAVFIPVAEECGLISAIGEWVLREACVAARRWSDSGMRVPISVNVSSRQFQDERFQASVKAVLDETFCDPSLIELEVTEGAMFADPAAAILSLKEIKTMGVAISIDDFGTGFSSLSYLKNLPADTIKIDRAFIDGLPSDSKNAAIAKAIVNLAGAMDIKVVAEGVEESVALSYLGKIGCDHVQGFYFSKPLAEKEFLDWYRRYDDTLKYSTC